MEFEQRGREDKNALITILGVIVAVIILTWANEKDSILNMILNSSKYIINHIFK